VARPVDYWWRAALEDAPISCTAYGVGCALARAMGTRDGVAWLSRQTIADRAHVHLRTAERAVTELERAGLLTVHRAGGDPSKTNRYTACVPGVTGGAVPLEGWHSAAGNGAATGGTQSKTGGTAPPELRRAVRSRSAHATAPAHAREGDAGYSDPANADAARQAAAEFRQRVGAGRPAAKGTGS